MISLLPALGAGLEKESRVWDLLNFKTVLQWCLRQVQSWPLMIICLQVANVMLKRIWDVPNIMRMQVHTKYSAHFLTLKTTFWSKSHGIILWSTNSMICCFRWSWRIKSKAGGSRYVSSWTSNILLISLDQRPPFDPTVMELCYDLHTQCSVASGGPEE